MSWPLVNLNDVAFFQEGPGIRNWQFRETGIKLVNVKNIVNGVLKLENSDKYLDEKEVQEKYSHFLVEEGDLLMASSGATWGKTAWVERRHLPICMNTSMIRFQSLDKNVLSIEYLAHYLTGPEFKKQMDRLITGSAQPNFGSTHLKQIQLPLPPLEEQKRIATILDKADAIRRKRQQAIKLADDFLSAEFLKRFGDPKDSPFGSRSLKDVTLKITDGAHFTPTYTDSGVPFLRVTDINRDNVDWSQVKYIPLEEHQELIKRCKPEKGDVLYSKNGTIGVPKLIDWDQEFSIFVSLCLIKPDPKFLRGRYLFSFLQTPFALKQATQKAKSATVTNLHLVEIKEIKLPVPSLAVQDEWINFVSRFNDTRTRLIQSLEKSNEVFNSLSQKAFSGQI